MSAGPRDAGLSQGGQLYRRESGLSRLPDASRAGGADSDLPATAAPVGRTRLWEPGTLGARSTVSGRRCPVDRVPAAEAAAAAGHPPLLHPAPPCPAAMPPAVTILIPVYDDSRSATLLLERLSAEAARFPCRLSVLFVDDGSSAAEAALLPGPTPAVPRVDVLHLRRTLGHQRAIAVGLASLAAGARPDFTVVMDGDGEDEPATLGPLLEAALAGDGHTAVFARRLKRQDGLGFLAGYHAFRLVHLTLVGRDVRVGNFSVLPLPVLDRVVGISGIWSHYAAAVLHARIPVVLVPTSRGRRLAGRSKMNLPALVAHGICGLSVWSDAIVARLFPLVGGMVVLALLVGAWGTRLPQAAAVPGWTAAAAAAVVVMLLAGVACLLAALVVFGGRTAANVLPQRDWRDYVLPGPTRTDGRDR